MREVCQHIPHAKPVCIFFKYVVTYISNLFKICNKWFQVHYEEKTALASLFLAKVLIEYHSENAGHFEDQEGLKKVLAINTSSHHSDKLRKAAGQVLDFFL